MFIWVHPYIVSEIVALINKTTPIGMLIYDQALTNLSGIIKYVSNYALIDNLTFSFVQFFCIWVF